MGEGLEKNIICITKEEHFDQYEQGETRKREVWVEHLEIKFIYLPKEATNPGSVSDKSGHLLQDT